MRWFNIRKADIHSEFREAFERQGPETMRAFVTMGPGFSIQGAHNTWSMDQVRPHLMPWLTEQYDRVERKETWLITMEVAITLFVLAELVFSIINFVRHG